MKQLLFLLLLFSLSVSAKQRYDFFYIDHLVEQTVGRYIIEEIYRQLDVNISVYAAPASRSERSLSNGVADGEIMRIYSYGEQNPIVIRVPTSYYQVETTAFVRADSGITISNFEDLQNYRVSRVRGIKHTEIASSEVKDVIELSNSYQLISFVQLGRGDVALTSRLDGKMTIAKRGYTDVIDVEKPLAVLPLYHYLHEDHVELAARVDNKIKELKASGELAAIVKAAEEKVLAEQD